MYAIYPSISHQETAPVIYKEIIKRRGIDMYFNNLVYIRNFRHINTNYGIIINNLQNIKNLFLHIFLIISIIDSLYPLFSSLLDSSIDSAYF